MQAVVFENAGEIDPRLISTFGVNVKEGDGAIGFFGTGLKYALAILLRHKQAVTIQSGEREFTFSLQSTEIRGKTFDLVAMNGEPMGFSSEVGKQWELWMAYRELYCNCQDEAGEVYETAAAPEPMAGKTRVIVQGAEFMAVRRDHHRYFVSSAPIYIGETCRIHEGPGHGIYYRSVLVGCAQRATVYTYDLTTPIELTEDRTVKSAYMADFEISKAILTCGDREIVRRAVTAPRDTHEHELDFDWSHIKPGEAFLSVVGDLLRRNFTSINPSARAAYEKHAKTNSEPERYEPDDFEQQMLDSALAFCSNFGFDITDYPVVVAERIGPSVLGMARKGKIYIARENFNLGTKQLAATLIEEFIHLRHEVPDCSRQMQEHLLNRLVTAGERLMGCPL